MGMFDEITCKGFSIPRLPDGMTFQTNDLECDLDQYELREDGTLWLMKHFGELLPEPQRIIPDESRLMMYEFYPDSDAGLTYVELKFDTTGVVASVQVVMPGEDWED